MKVKLRAFHLWWLGVVLFAPTVFVWLATFAVAVIMANGHFNFSFDWIWIKRIYLPFLAALLGFSIPVICLRILKSSLPRVWIPVFVAYVLIMLAWGVVDIRCENYQMGGHEYPDGPLVDGHKYYVHTYFTWHFLPYKWIEKGI